MKRVITGRRWGSRFAIGRRTVRKAKLACEVIVAASGLLSSAEASQATNIAPSTAAGFPLKIATFGTSLTAKGGWQDALRVALETCTGGPVVVETIAKSGASSRWALTVVADVLALKPDIVLVEFSANDAALDRLLPLAWSEANIRKIVRQLRSGAPNARIALMAMNPVIGMRGAIRPFLDDYYDVNRTIARDTGLTFIDHRPGWNALSRAALEAAIPDGSHPEPAVATGIIVPNVRKALFESCSQANDRSNAAVPSAAP